MLRDIIKPLVKGLMIMVTLVALSLILKAEKGVYFPKIGNSSNVQVSSGTGTKKSSEKITYTLAGTLRQVDGKFVQPAILRAPLKKCKGFDVKLNCNAKFVPGVAEWKLYVCDEQGNWLDVQCTAITRNGVGTTTTVRLPQTMDVSGVVAIRKTNTSNGAYNVGYDITNPVYAALGGGFQETMNRILKRAEELWNQIMKKVRTYEFADVFLKWWSGLQENMKPIAITVWLVLMLEVWSALSRTNPEHVRTGAAALQPLMATLFKTGVSAGVKAIVKGILASEAFAALMSTVAGYAATVYASVKIWYMDLDDHMKILVFVLVVLVIRKIVNLICWKIGKASSEAGGE